MNKMLIECKEVRDDKKVIINILQIESMKRLDETKNDKFCITMTNGNLYTVHFSYDNYMDICDLLR